MSGACTKKRTKGGDETLIVNEKEKKGSDGNKKLRETRDARACRNREIIETNVRETVGRKFISP